MQIGAINLAHERADVRQLRPLANRNRHAAAPTHSSAGTATEPRRIAAIPRQLKMRGFMSWRVPSSRLLSAGRSLALVVFEPRLHELVEFLHLFVGVGFWRAVFQPTEHVSFD